MVYCESLTKLQNSFFTKFWKKQLKNQKQSSQQNAINCSLHIGLQTIRLSVCKFQYFLRIFCFCNLVFCDFLIFLQPLMIIITSVRIHKRNRKLMEWLFHTIQYHSTHWEVDIIELISILCKKIEICKLIYLNETMATYFCIQELTIPSILYLLNCAFSYSI